MAAVASVAGFGPGPAQSVEVRPGTERAAVQERASAASALPQQAMASLLRRLPPLSNGSRLSGEEASLSAPVYVTRKQADAKARFRLGTLSSVSVLPESGTLTVSLNGANIKVLPEGLLRQGWNAVGIAAHHRHRVDCSVDATEELWTRVDPAETGLMFADGSAGLADPADIAAIGSRPDGVVPIGVVLDSQHLLKPEAVERIGRAVQGIALVGRFASGGGIRDLRGRSRSRGGSAADSPEGSIGAAIGQVDGPTSPSFPALNRRPVVVVTGQSDADSTLPQSWASRPLAPSGIECACRRTVMKSAPMAKSSPSATSASINGNSWATRCALVPAPPCRGIRPPIGRVAIDLAGGYAAGLGADAQIIVEVNGHGAGSVRLSSANGEFPPQATFPAAERIPSRAEPHDCGSTLR
jgi:hypothetical protein